MTSLKTRADWPECQQLVAARMESLFQHKLWRAKPYGRQYSALWDAARRSATGGKKIRPALVGNTYRLLGGQNDDHAVAVATAFELMHTAFLLHDDVIDGDTVRRGELNVVGSFAADASNRGVGEDAALAWGEASAILAGDLLIHASGDLVSRLELDTSTRTALLDLLDECLFVTVAGELADVAFSSAVEAPVLSEVLAMTQWKTAHYTFQAPLQAGAILAGASQALRQMLGAFGAQIGIAFQLRDDLLGVFGTESTIGKSGSSDIDEGKITPLMFHALQMSQTDELREHLEADAALGRDHARIRELVEASGARALIEHLIVERRQEASLYLDAPGVPPALKAYLLEIAHHACERNA